MKGARTQVLNTKGHLPFCYYLCCRLPSQAQREVYSVYTIRSQTISPPHPLAPSTKMNNNMSLTSQQSSMQFTDRRRCELLFFLLLWYLFFCPPPSYSFLYPLLIHILLSSSRSLNSSPFLFIFLQFMAISFSNQFCSIALFSLFLFLSAT